MTSISDRYWRVIKLGIRYFKGNTKITFVTKKSEKYSNIYCKPNQTYPTQPKQQKIDPTRVKHFRPGPIAKIYNKKSITLWMIGIMDFNFPLVKTGEIMVLISFHLSPLITVNMFMKYLFVFMLATMCRRSTK